MKALYFDVSVSGFLRAKCLGRSVMFGGLGTTSLKRIPEPELPGPNWVKLDVLGCGICGTDIATVSYAASPALEPFGSFPAVLGHEILARVSACGREVSEVEVGQRVAVDPLLSCDVRGFGGTEICGSCRAGWPGTCERGADQGLTTINKHQLAPGTTIGFHSDLPGGFSEKMVAHRSQLFAVDEKITDRTAVLTEPLSVAVHAALGTRTHQAEPVLVIGSGTIALATIWALRSIGFKGEIFSQTKREHEANLARQLGATGAVSPGAEARQAMLGTGARSYRPIIGDEVYAGGGFPLIFDCVGNAASLDQSLRFASNRGRIAILGCAAKIRHLDLTFVWAHELSIVGYVVYGIESWRGQSKHTFEVTQELMVENPSVLPDLVTHVLPLSECRQALKTASDHGKSGAVKVVIEP